MKGPTRLLIAGVYRTAKSGTIIRLTEEQSPPETPASMRHRNIRPSHRACFRNSTEASPGAELPPKSAPLDPAPGGLAEARLRAVDPEDATLDRFRHALTPGLVLGDHSRSKPVSAREDGVGGLLTRPPCAQLDEIGLKNRCKVKTKMVAPSKRIQVLYILFSLEAAVLTKRSLGGSLICRRDASERTLTRLQHGVVRFFFLFEITDKIRGHMSRHLSLKRRAFRFKRQKKVVDEEDTIAGTEWKFSGIKDGV
jgi:hypothetical protein